MNFSIDDSMAIEIGVGCCAAYCAILVAVGVTASPTAALICGAIDAQIPGFFDWRLLAGF
jgi:hypothetical protein